MALEIDAAKALYVPIAYGSIAFWLGNKTSTASAPHTHKWMVYVRPIDNEDLGQVISKVVFQLHPSFAVSKREVLAPPFVVEESGWGEFEVGISIHFRDLSLEPISVIHKLALFPTDGFLTIEKPVISEHYDELVFNETPKDRALLAALTGGSRLGGGAAAAGAAGPTAYPYQDFFPAYSAEDDLAKIAAARQFLQDRKLEFQDRLLQRQMEAEREKQELKQLGMI